MIDCRRFFMSVTGFHTDDCTASSVGGNPLDPVRRWDAGIDLGMGIRAALSADARLVGAIRYGRSLLHMEPGTGVQESSLNRVVALMVGFEVTPALAVRP